MELRTLKSFVAVAEELHFGRAAGRLHLAPPALSRQIQQLEAEIGVQLFIRSTRNVTLTPAGAVFLVSAHKVIDGAEEARLSAVRAERGELGRISVGFAGSASHEFIPRAIREFRESYPEVALDLQGELTSPRQVEAIRDGDLDVGFVRPTPGLADLGSRVVVVEQLTALVPHDHRFADRDSIDVADLRDEPFISYSGSTSMAAVVHSTCRRAGFEPHVLNRARESHTVVCLVAAGMGVALVPQAVKHFVSPGARQISIPENQSEIVTLLMVWRPDDASPTVRRFVDRISEMKIDY